MVFRKVFAGTALVAAALALGSCSQASETPAASEAATDKTYELTPAVIAMRWQLLNPEIISFTFRDTDRVFESRAVARAGAVWDIPRGETLAMP